MIRGASRRGTVVLFEPATVYVRVGEVLRAEASRLERLIGRNAYTDYINRHGRRPSPVEADTIGRLTGLRVKATDGKRYPRRTSADRKQQQRRFQSIAQISQVRSAMAYLAEGQIEPELLAAQIEGDDATAISQHIEKAVCWLSRFVEEWNSRNGQGIASKVPDDCS